MQNLFINFILKKKKYKKTNFWQKQKIFLFSYLLLEF
jgi:hypothetical protein